MHGISKTWLTLACAAAAGAASQQRHCRLLASPQLSHQEMLLSASIGRCDDHLADTTKVVRFCLGGNLMHHRAHLLHNATSSAPSGLAAAAASAPAAAAAAVSPVLPRFDVRPCCCWWLWWWCSCCSSRSMACCVAANQRRSSAFRALTAAPGGVRQAGISSSSCSSCWGL